MNARGPKYDPAIVNDALDIKALAEKHGAADWHKGGGYYLTRCIFPDHPDRNPSFVVYTDSNHFHCFGCGRAGDPLKLIQEFYGWTARRDFPRVMKRAAELAGVEPTEDPEAAALAKARLAEKRKIQQAREAEERRAKEEGALKRWLSGRKIAVGDAQFSYLLNRRGVDLRELPRWPSAIRVIDDFRWNVAPKGEADEWRPFPVICSALTRGGKITATHLTFLKPGTDELDRSIGQNGRIVLGSARGASMHIARGKSGLAPKDAFAKHGMDDTLALCEGLEDGLSIALVMPEWRVWPCYSLDNIANAELPDCAGEVVLCAENDASKGAQNALTRVQEKLLGRAMRPVRIAFPPAPFKDWNAMHNPEGK